MDEPSDGNDRDYVSAATRQRDRGALGAGAGCVGVVEHQHSPASHGADQAEAPPAGVKMPERLGTLRDHRCQRQPGLSHEGRGDEADERVLAAPGGALRGAGRHRHGERGGVVLEDRSDEATEVEVQELAEEPRQGGLSLIARST